MNDSYRRVEVYIRGKYAGELKETDTGYSFKYCAEYLQCPDAVPASLTLPLGEESYTSSELFPFFDGLIPEGWLLDVASRNWKIDRNDRFGLLMVSCYDCIGDVSIRGVSHEM